MHCSFTEYTIPADMTDGDAIDFLRLTGKANSLRRAMGRYGRFAGRRDLSAALDATKLELRYLTSRYA